MDTSTAAYRILEITTIPSELSCDTLSRIHIGKSYEEKLITHLKEDQLIEAHYRDKLRGYRLISRGEKLPLAQNPGRSFFYLTGSSDTSQPQSGYPGRLRLHQTSRAYCLIPGAGITIFRDKKPALFSGVPPDDIHIFPFPVFYQSRELREFGMETVKINNFRAIGIPSTESLIFPVFYAGGIVIKWGYKTEIRLKALLSRHITQRVPSGHYCHKIPVHVLFIGSNMGTAVKLMANAGGVRYSLFMLDTSFDYFHFIPDSHAGKILLKVLYSPAIGRQLTILLLPDLETANPSISMEYDAVRMGQLALLAYDSSMLRIPCFIATLKLQRQTGYLVCFDFQKKALPPYCGGAATISTINLTEPEKGFFS